MSSPAWRLLEAMRAADVKRDCLLQHHGHLWRAGPRADHRGHAAAPDQSLWLQQAGRSSGPWPITPTPTDFGYAALRYFNAAGASPDGDLGEVDRSQSRLIPLVLQVALGQREAITIFGDDYPTPDGTCIRDYIHVDDLGSAHLQALERLTPGKGLLLNLGTGRGHSVRQVIDACRRVSGREIPVRLAPRRPGDPAARGLQGAHERRPPPQRGAVRRRDTGAHAVDRSHDDDRPQFRRGAARVVPNYALQAVGRTVCVALDLAMQRQDIADYLGLTIETVSRTFTLFRDRGFLRLPRKRRVEIVRPDALALFCRRGQGRGRSNRPRARGGGIVRRSRLIATPDCFEWPKRTSPTPIGGECADGSEGRTSRRTSTCGNWSRLNDDAGKPRENVRLSRFCALPGALRKCDRNANHGTGGTTCDRLCIREFVASSGHYIWRHVGKLR